MMIDINNGTSFNNTNGNSQYGQIVGASASARNSTKRQPRLFINVNTVENSNQLGSASNNHKRQPLMGSGGVSNTAANGGVHIGGLVFDPSQQQLNSDQHRRKGVGNNTASHNQVPQLQQPQYFPTSNDSRGNQSSSSNNGNGVQVISRKFIHFAGGNNPHIQTSSRAATHSQKRHNNLMIQMGMLPVAQLNFNPHDPGSQEIAQLSGRSGRSGGISDFLQSSRGGNVAAIGAPLNERTSQRKSNGGPIGKFPGQSNAVSAPHHQLGYRRQQIMDITDDTNSNSKIKLALGNSQEETLNSQETERDKGNAGQAFNVFYHASSGSSHGDQLNRFNSKKSLKNHQSKLDSTSPYSHNSGTNTGGIQRDHQLFQFTRKQNLMNADNSVSATRESGVKLIKLKKPQPLKISLHKDTLYTSQVQLQQTTVVPQIGKRRPLIIRKNNYITGATAIQGNSTSNERGSQRDNSEYNLFNKTSNFTTLITGGGAGMNSNQMNNTNSFVGLSSEASLSNVHLTSNQKYQTAGSGGIQNIIKSLNSTTQSLGLDIQNKKSSSKQLIETQHKLSQNSLTLKDSKLIKLNMSKKRLDTARKSRLNQITLKEPHSLGTYNLIGGAAGNTLTQQPSDFRQQKTQNQMTQQRSSILVPKVSQQTHEKTDHIQTTNNGGASYYIPTRTNERESRRDTLRQNGAIIEQEEVTSQQKMEKVSSQQKIISKSEDRTATHHIGERQTSLAPQNANKVLSRGQIMRLMKQKQQILLIGNTNDSEHKLNTITDKHFKKEELSPIINIGESGMNPNKSTKSIGGIKEQEHISHALLPRVESKKDLQHGFPINSFGVNFEKHLMKEELIIFENINDCSGTPGTFTHIKTPEQINNSTTNPKILHIQEGSEQYTQLNQPSVSDEPKYIESSKIDSEEFRQVNISSIQKEVSPPSQIPIEQSNDSISQNKAERGGEPEVKMIAVVQEDMEALNLKKERLQNSSIALVKSPIRTTTSFKSQNSQQAGQNIDETVKFPMRPGKALKLFMNQLSNYERGEILDYQDIYFLGLTSEKIHGSPNEEFNCGFDDDKGDYNVIIKDHISYRYEIMGFLGKGSFGTAVKCFDHKTKEEIAVKIVKNKKKYAYQAGVELKILNFLKENDPDDIMNVVHMKDYIIFRKHLCITFELLSMNLFEFLKINDFNGFDHNLIRRFAIQLLYALKYLREFSIIHCDLKPENILLKEANKSGIKIIDFGSSTFLDERVYTYIQSRFYRAPEIMLGIPYTCAIDMWSFGCIMAELFIGYPIFPGESENDQMSRIIEMVNVPSKEVYDISQRKSKFFTEDSKGTFEPIMLKNSRGKLRKPAGKPLSLLLGDEDPHFLDFVTKCLEWDPEVRLTPDEALRHIWILKGLPPQVLVHHQRMHNILTPELPESVRAARDQFFVEMTLQQENASTAGGGLTTSQGGCSGQSNSGTRVTGKSQQQQQSSNPQQRSSHQTGGTNGTAALNASAAVMKAAASNKLQSSNIKAETIKSLERAQLKNHLNQLNTQKVQMQQASAMLKTGGGGGAISLHSKVTTLQVQAPFAQSNRSQPLKIQTSSSNTARLHQLQAQLPSTNNSAGPQVQQQYPPLNSKISPAKVPSVGVVESSGSSKISGFKRRNHMAAARHQRNMNLNNRTQEGVTN